MVLGENSYCVRKH